MACGLADTAGQIRITGSQLLQLATGSMARSRLSQLAQQVTAAGCHSGLAHHFPAVRCHSGLVQLAAGGVPPCCCSRSGPHRGQLSKGSMAHRRLRMLAQHITAAGRRSGLAHHVTALRSRSVLVQPVTDSKTPRSGRHSWLSTQGRQPGRRGCKSTCSSSGDSSARWGCIGGAAAAAGAFAFE